MLNLLPLNKGFNHIASLTASNRAIYSASVYEAVTELCFCEQQQRIKQESINLSAQSDISKLV